MTYLRLLQRQEDVKRSAMRFAVGGFYPIARDSNSGVLIEFGGVMMRR